MTGCCADKSCTEKTCMKLPEGKTCRDCRHFLRCNAMFGAELTDSTCDFYPRKFIAIPEAK